MENYNVYIPEGKSQFFKNLIENLGYQYTKNEDFVIPEWQKEEVRKRLEDHKNNPNDVLDFDEAMKDIEAKYDL